MNLKINSITLTRTFGGDYVYLNTDLPYQYPAYAENNLNAVIVIECPVNTAEEYCKKNFPFVPVNIINGKI